jgi:MFS family permease
VRVLDALRHPDFRLLWSGQTVSLIGDAAFLTALGWRTFTLAGSTRFGIVLVCQSTALLATLLVGGALADRYERRTLMIVSDVWRFGAVAALAAADATGHLSFGLLLALATLNGLGDGFFYPAVGGIVPLVVEPPSLPSANSLMGVARWGSLLVGPSLAAFVYGAAGSAWVFALDALSFLLSAALIARARPRRIDAPTGEGTLGEIRAGARYVAGVPWLWVTIALFAVVLMLQFAPQQVLLPKLVKEQFGGGVRAYGFLTTLLGVGTIAGTLLFGQIQPRRRRGIVSYAIWVLNSLAILGLALSPWYALAGAFAVFRGLCLGFGIAVWETMLMELVPEHLLSRVLSFDFFGSMGLTPVGFVIAGAAAAVVSPQLILAVGGTLGMLLWFVPLAWREVRSVT